MVNHVKTYLSILGHRHICSQIRMRLGYKWLHWHKGWYRQHMRFLFPNLKWIQWLFTINFIFTKEKFKEKNQYDKKAASSLPLSHKMKRCTRWGIHIWKLEPDRRTQVLDNFLHFGIYVLRHSMGSHIGNNLLSSFRDSWNERKYIKIRNWIKSHKCNSKENYINS